MTRAPLRMNISPRQVYLAGLLYNDIMNWEDFSFEEKTQIYFIDWELDGIVSQSEMREFERELALSGELGTLNKALSSVFSKMKVTPETENKVRRMLS